jgi:hypothetical protein
MKAIIKKAKNVISATFNREFNNIKEINGISNNLFCKINEETDKMKKSELFTQEEIEQFEEQTKDDLYYTQLEAKKRTTERLRQEWEVFK